jgi:hypothetical protein
VKFEYKNAGTDAPEGVQAAIEEFDRLPQRVKSELPLLYFLLGSGTPPYKMSSRDAGYVLRTVDGQNCANCSSAFQHVVTGELICDQIRGEIKPHAWCRLWNRE